MYLLLTFLALWIGIARAQFDIPTAMMMGMEPQQAMMFMGSGSGTGGGTGGGMDGMGGGGMSGGGGGNEFGQGGGQGNTRGGGNMGGALDGNGGGGGGGGGGGNMEMQNGGGGGGGNRFPNDRGNRFNRHNFNNQQNMGRFNMGGGGGGGSSNSNMGGSNTMMAMMLCQETPSRFRELPCNLNNPQSCPMSQYLTCQSGVYFYPVCCAKDWRSLRIVDVMF
ncbi:hypothetical protein ACJMK2_039860 [Sinanodonta woodiana]|uniref:Uncharacterized protein n=1 Tax=Sinanodonta woodiana TaxID=1069815 RepID=A0ABD3WGN4_SINWO